MPGGPRDSSGSPYGFRREPWTPDSQPWRKPEPPELGRRRHEQKLKLAEEGSAALDDSHVKSWTQTDNVGLLLDALNSHERLDLALVASRRGETGLLALTDSRVLYVASHLRGAPTKIVMLRSTVTFAAVQPHVLGSAQIRVWTADDETVFSLVKPRTRAWQFLGLLFAGMDECVVPETIGGAPTYGNPAFPVDPTPAAFATPPLDDEHVKGRGQRGNVRLLLAEVGLREGLELTLVGSRRMTEAGLLALTDRRLIYVCADNEPTRVSLPRDEITYATIEPQSSEAVALHAWLGAEQSTFSLLRPPARAWRLLGLLLARMEDFVLPGGLDVIETQTIAADDTWMPRALARGEPTMIEATADAQAEIRAHGGTLYLWQQPFNHDLLVDKLALSRPDLPIEFNSISDDDIDVQVERALGRPTELRIELARFPHKHLKVFWDGDRWGSRGTTVA